MNQWDNFNEDQLNHPLVFRWVTPNPPNPTAVMVKKCVVGGLFLYFIVMYFVQMM